MGIIMCIVSWFLAALSVGSPIENWYKIASVVMGLLGSGFLIKSIIFDEE